jgi:hypothetical protein
MRLEKGFIDDLVAALRAFNPECTLRTKMRLNRNLRRLIAAQKEKNEDRQFLALETIGDKNRKIDPGNLQMTVAEAQELQKECRKMDKETVEIEIHPVEIYDSSAGETAAEKELAIDVSELSAEFSQNSLLNVLLDVVLVAKGE